jgi:hypothetical protein
MSRCAQSIETAAEAAGRRDLLGAVGAVGLALLASLVPGAAGARGGSGNGKNKHRKKRGAGTEKRRRVRKLVFKP